MGYRRAEQLVDAGLVTRLSDLYTLPQEDLLRLGGYAERSARNLLHAIEESLEQDLDRFLYALGIPLVGVHIARQLARRFPDLDAVTSAPSDALRAVGLTLRNPYHGETQPLAGRTFVFTGRLDRWTREEVQRLVERLGGRAASSVSSATNYVVAGPGAGQKRADAEAHDVPVLDEEAFVSLLEEQTGSSDRAVAFDLEPTPPRKGD